MSLNDVIAGASAGSTLGPVGAAVGGLLGLVGGNQRRKEEKKALQQAQATADPFSQYRGQFVDKLMGLYGVQKPFQYANQNELDTLTSRQNLAKPYSQGDLLNIGLGKAGSANERAFRALQNKAVLTPEEEARLAELQKERATQEQQYKSSAQTPEQLLMNIPGYQFALQQGTEAATRRAAATGHGMSGNLLTELQRVGTGTAAQYYNQEADRLAQLSGATGTAGAGAQYAAQVPSTKPYEGAGAFIGALQGLGSLFGSGGGGGGLTAADRSRITPGEAQQASIFGF